MPRSLASLTIAFGLVAIPVRLYPATRRSAGLRFKWMTAAGGAVRQRLVADKAATVDEPYRLPVPAPGGDVAEDVDEELAPGPRPTNDVVRAFDKAVVPTERQDQHASTSNPASPVPEDSVHDQGDFASRAGFMKGLEIEPGRFVLFTPAELDELATPRRDSIDLVSFVPPHAVDPVYVEKSYFLAPARHAERPFALLVQAMQQTRRCALAKWAWRGREHPALIRPGSGVLVLHQLHSGDAVRDASEFAAELPAMSGQAVQLAVQLIEQSSSEHFEPADFIDPARQRILDAARRKLSGGAVFDQQDPPPASESAEVIDLVAALRASLAAPAPANAPAPAPVARRPPRRASSATGQKKRAGGG